MTEARANGLQHFREELLPILTQALRERETRAVLSRDVRSIRRTKRTVALLLAATLPLVVWMLASAGADDTITVDAADALRNPAAVESELRERGIRADVRVVPTDWSLAGKWFNLYFPPGSPVDRGTWGVLRAQVGSIDMGIPAVAERCPRGVGCGRTAALELPTELPGRITLVVGRLAKPGERYWSRHMDSLNELAPSGALYCYRLEELPPAEAGALLQRLGYELIWLYEQDFFHSTSGGEVREPPAGSRLWYAWFRNPKVIDLRVASPHRARAWAEQSGTPTPQHPRSSAPWAQC